MSFYTNIDSSTSFFPYLQQLIEENNITEDAIAKHADEYADSQITDVLYNISGQVSMTESKILTDYAEKYEQTEEFGIHVNYKDFYGVLYTVQKKMGINIYDVCIRRTRQRGQKAWLSFRMNDAHDPFGEVGVFRPSFYYKARDNGWLIGDGYGDHNYFKICYNYAYKEVRDFWLSYIAEQLERFDVDGIELDFMREIFCFKYESFDGADIMNGFMREAKALVGRFEAKYGHKIKIGVSLARDIDQCRTFGFDARTWDKEGLCDVIFVRPRWFTCDSHMPVAVWKKECPHTEIAAGLEINTTVMPETSLFRFESTTAPVARGYAVHYYAEGADSLYLYNFFVTPVKEGTKVDAVIGSLPVANYAGKHDINRGCGNLTSAAEKSFRYVLTYQESETVPKGETAFNPLPMVLTDEKQTVNMNIGFLPEGRRAVLVLGLKDGTAEDVRVEINGKVLGGFEECDRSTVETDCREKFVHDDVKLYRATLDAKDAPDYAVSLAKTGKNDAVLVFMSIDVL